MADPTETTETAATRYFKLDTKDSTFAAQTYYAAWRFPTALLFMINDAGKAQVMFVLKVPVLAELRRAVSEEVTDVVGYAELPERPNINDVDLSLVAGQIDATTVGTLLEV